MKLAFRPTKLKRADFLGELLILEPVQTKGKLSCEEDVFIDNKHTGDIHSAGFLTIGQNALIKGDVDARVIRIFGSVTGSARAKDALTIESSAHIAHGTLEASLLDIQSGARMSDVIITTK